MSDYQAGEYTLNGVTHKLTAAQMQAMDLLRMPSLETRFQGYALTGRYTSNAKYYEGKNGKHYHNPTVHYRTAASLRDRGLVTLEHDLGLQAFVVRPVKEIQPPCGLCGQTVYMENHPALGWSCRFDGNINSEESYNGPS